MTLSCLVGNVALPCLKTPTLLPSVRLAAGADGLEANGAGLAAGGGTSAFASTPLKTTVWNLSPTTVLPPFCRLAFPECAPFLPLLAGPLITMSGAGEDNESTIVLLLVALPIKIFVK